MANNKSYLLLGEGDFTYSLDMCRYIASSILSAKTSSNKVAAVVGKVKEELKDTHHKIDGNDALLTSCPVVSITCTGVDTLSELRDKYKDIEFILRNIRACSSVQCDDDNTSSTLLGASDISKNDRKSSINTSILHGINAVKTYCKDDDDNIIHDKFDHAIFNHPHLGTEDAQLHSRFLKHLFYTCTQRWLKPNGGILHLTLVIGQCDRWKCIEGAKKHGLVLLSRGEFIPPPPPLQVLNDADDDGKQEAGDRQTYYKLRRHQSGRSFANRRRMQQPNEEGSSSCSNGQTNDSETLVFGRACDYGDATATNVDQFLLPWEAAVVASGDTNQMQSMISPSATTAQDKSSHNNTTTNLLQCKYCSRSFVEHRSLKNHTMNSHSDCAEVRIWKEEKSSKKKQKKNKKRKLNEEDGGGDGRNNQEGINVDGSDKNGSQSSINDESAHTPSDKEPSGPPWICTICQSEQNTADGQANETRTRVFPHEQALLDHKRAKHTGTHVNIKPDWYSGDNLTIDDGDDINQSHNNNTQADDKVSCCPICDQIYTSEGDKLYHAMEFVPPKSSLAAQHAAANSDDRPSSNKEKQKSCPVYKCTYCTKPFRELRAQLQHENFCSESKKSICT